MVALIVYLFIGSFFYGSLKLISYIFKFNISDIFNYSIYLTLLYSSLLLSTRDMEIEKSTKKIDELNLILSNKAPTQKYARLLEEYKILENDYKSCIKSINNAIPNLHDVVEPENIIQNSDYLAWGSGIVFAIVLCGLGYYFLSNQPHQFFARIFENNNLDAPVVYAQAVPHYPQINNPQINNVQELAIDYFSDLAIDRVLLNIQTDIIYEAFMQHAEATQRTLEEVAASQMASQQAIDQILVAILT